MMEHLDEGAMQALLDGEVDDETGLTTRVHLESCSACAVLYTRLRERATTFASAVSLLDRSAPRRVIPLLPAGGRPLRRSRLATALPRAAILVFGFAVAASASIPGSPVRGWIETRLGALDGPVPLSEREAIATPVDAPSMNQMGIGIAPADGRLRIVVTGAAPDLRIRAVLTDARTGGAFSSGDAPGTRFRGGGGLVEVFDAAGEELRVEIPATATFASLEIDGRTYVLKDGDRLRLITSGVDRLASEVVFQVDP